MKRSGRGTRWKRSALRPWRWRRSRRPICGATEKPVSSPPAPHNPSRAAGLIAYGQQDQPERANDDAPPCEQPEAVTLHIAEERLHHDPGGDERHREADRDDQRIVKVEIFA